MKNYELIPAGEVMARLLKKEEIFAVDLAMIDLNKSHNNCEDESFLLNREQFNYIGELIEGEDMLFFKKVGAE